MEYNTNDLAPYLFCQGTNTYSYDYLGVHAEEKNGIYKYTFRVWAPNADQIFVVGDFNGYGLTALVGDNPHELIGIYIDAVIKGLSSVLSET